MKRSILFYISGHGLGHSSRCCEVIRKMQRMAPQYRYLIRTPAPRWFFDVSLGDGFEQFACQLDIGVVQKDSLHLEEEKTLEAYASLLKRKESLIGEELSFLRGHDVALVVGDIPPLSFEIAEMGGVKGVAIANFSWDWIYAPYVEKFPFFRHLIEEIRSSYRHAHTLLRLPLHGDLSVFSQIVDIPLIARKSQKRPKETREILGLPLDRKIVLMSFGGHGVQDIHLLPLKKLDDVLFVTDDASKAVLPNIFMLRPSLLNSRGLRYEDLVRASDVVVTKPGYGIVAECIANQTPILYTSRGDFPEYEVLVKGMERYLNTSYLSLEEFLAGRWEKQLVSLLSEEKKFVEEDVSGAFQAARYLCALLA